MIFFLSCLWTECFEMFTRSSTSLFFSAELPFCWIIFSQVFLTNSAKFFFALFGSSMIPLAVAHIAFDCLFFFVEGGRGFVCWNYNPGEREKNGTLNVDNSFCIWMLRILFLLLVGWLDGFGFPHQILGNCVKAREYKIQFFSYVELQIFVNMPFDKLKKKQQQCKNYGLISKKGEHYPNNVVIVNKQISMPRGSISYKVISEI